MEESWYEDGPELAEMLAELTEFEKIEKEIGFENANIAFDAMHNHN